MSRELVFDYSKTAGFIREEGDCKYEESRSWGERGSYGKDRSRK